jgi:peroxiredoxin
LVRDTEEIERRGARIAVIFCQGRKSVGSWLEKRPYPWPILADEDRNVAKAWDVYQRIGLDAIHIARPAMFLIAPNGFVRAARVGSSQTDLPGREWILSAIEAPAIDTPR